MRFLRLHAMAIAAFMLCALAARAALPAGWMPSNAGGQPTIMLCTGEGLVTAWIDAQGNLRKDAPEKAPAADQPCAFAATTLAALPDAIGPQGAAPEAIDDATEFPFATVSIGQGLAAPPPPSTGPPALG